MAVEAWNQNSLNMYLNNFNTRHDWYTYFLTLVNLKIKGISLIVRT
jgi:hypothetical protein